MMIDFALEAERDEGSRPREAIYQACLLRFRPIMMTTMAALLGGLPLALGTGTGSELRRPLGIAIVGGLIISQVLTLFTTPVIYLYMGRLASLARRRRRRSADAGAGRGDDAPAATAARSAVNISEPFIRRPIATSLLALGDPARGGCGVPVPPGRAAARASTSRPSRSARRSRARSPETMASSVATPLERRFGRIAGVTEITSIEHARLDVASRSSSTSTATSTPPRATCRPPSTPPAASCPPTCPRRPTYRKVNPADSPILILSLTSDTLPLPEVFDAANTILAQKISQVNGVGQVTVGGGQQPAVRVAGRPGSARRHRPEPRGRAQRARAHAPSTSPRGPRRGDARRTTIAANDQLFDAAARTSTIIVTYQNGAAVRLSDVANGLDDVENNRVAGWIERQARRARSSSGASPAPTSSRPSTA